MLKSLFPSTKNKNRRTVRSTKVQAEYDAWQQTMSEQYGDDMPCPLCRDVAEQIIVRDFGSMLVVENDFPYDMYDGIEIDKHLMLIPKRHIATFSQFNEQEKNDYWRGYCELSSHGFGTMTQASTSQYRSVPTHIHTHLLRYRI